MRVGIRDAERLKDSPSSAPVCALGHLPPTGGKALSRSNREGFCPLWDVWIHILGIGAECACGGAGGPVCRPYGGDVASPVGASGRPRPTKGSAGAQCAPLHREGAGNCPLIRLAYGQPPSPQGEGLGKSKRDRFWTCPLKHRGEAELRRKFFCLLFFQEK